MEFPRGQDLVGEWRKWAEALCASTERVTGSNAKGAKSMAILLHLHYPQDPCLQQTRVLLCHNPEKGTSALWAPIPPPLPTLGSHATPARGARVSREPGRLTKCWRSKVASARSSLQSTSGRSGKGFRTPGLEYGEDPCTEGCLTGWRKSCMVRRGSHRECSAGEEGELLCVHRRSVCCLPAGGARAAVADVPRTLGWSRVLEG